MTLHKWKCPEHGSAWPLSAHGGASALEANERAFRFPVKGLFAKHLVSYVSGRGSCSIQNLVFCAVAPCGRAGRYQRFWGTYCLHLLSWKRVCCYIKSVFSFSGSGCMSLPRTMLCFILLKESCKNLNVVTFCVTFCDSGLVSFWYCLLTRRFRALSFAKAKQSQTLKRSFCAFWTKKGKWISAWRKGRLSLACVPEKEHFSFKKLFTEGRA